MTRIQTGMFLPIRVDHTNCLQVAIKTHSSFISTGHPGFVLTVDACLSAQKHAARDESDRRLAGGPQSDEQVSRIAMSRPHPSLEILENGQRNKSHRHASPG